MYLIRHREIRPFVLIWIASVPPFINKPDSVRHITVFMKSFISSLEIICVVVPCPNIFSWTAALVADDAAVNPEVVKHF